MHTIPVVLRLGSALLAAGKTGNARELYQNALEIAERTLPPVHKDMVMHLRRLAVAKNLESDREGSQQLLDRAVAVEQRLVEQVHEAVSPSLATADSSIRRGLLEDGELQLRKAILTVEEALGSRHKYLLEPLEGLVKVLTSLGRLEDAQSYQRQLTAILQSESGGSQVTAAQSIESAGGEEQVGAFFSALSETGKFRMDRITRVANQLNISRRSIDVSDSGQVAVGDGMLDVAPGESVGNSNPTPVPITRYKQGHDERAPPGNAPVCGSSGEPEEYGEIGGTCQDDVSVQPNLAALKASGSYSQAASLCSPQVHDRQESDGAGSMQLAEAFKQ